MDTQSTWQIVIAERGWVYVGRISRDGDQVVIRDAQNVRRWGTTKGLGELAMNGPLAETQLDPYGTVRIHVLAVCGTVECDDKVWNAWAAKQAKAKR
jgi:hypothetical protein